MPVNYVMSCVVHLRIISVLCQKVTTVLIQLLLVYGAKLLLVLKLATSEITTKANPDDLHVYTKINDIHAVFMC